MNRREETAARSLTQKYIDSTLPEYIADFGRGNPGPTAASENSLCARRGKSGLRKARFRAKIFRRTNRF